MRLVSSVLVLSMFVVSSQAALAQSARSFKVNTLVSSGKKSSEVDSTLSFGENQFTILSDKPGRLNKQMAYADVTAADYSYSKKPLLSTGGAVAMAILTGLLVLPFLFVKKKQHWLTVRTANDYAVMRLDKENYRQIQSEFEIKKVKIATIEDQDKKGN